MQLPRSTATALVVGAALASGFAVPSQRPSRCCLPRTPPRQTNLDYFGARRRGNHHRSEIDTTLCAAGGEDDTDLRAEAAALKAKAEQLRSEIERDESTRNSVAPPSSSQAGAVSGGSDDASSAATAAAAAATTTTTASVTTSPWAIVPSSSDGDDDAEGDYREEYRLYVDVGREEGTWMDPRWGASGNRIQFTLDVALLTNRAADPENAAKMVKDNSMGKSSAVGAVDTARFARLRDGFDRMECKGSAFRVDRGSDNARGRTRSVTNTMRMVVDVEGTTKADQAYVYGDVSVPEGPLYFSLPAFGAGVANLSTKEGVVSVRQVGWHTGWRREESRILGVFTAKKLDEAKKRDGY